MGDKILPVLLGGLITLVGTFLVQLYVVPRVQARTRRLERWEKDVIELVALIEEQLPLAVEAYHMASLGPRIARQRRNDPEADHDRLEMLLAEWTGEQREAREALGEKMSRLDVLHRRVRRENADAPYWTLLADQRRHFRIPIMQVDIWRIDEDANPEDEEWETAWKRIDEEREKLLNVVLQIAEPPKPPRRPRLRTATRVRGIFGGVRRRLSLSVGSRPERVPKLRQD
ncbi:hypothetical protein GCM10010399_47830 [Dactylosporangium fulvum]|uniref:Secreted protein n=1 Tax=Dactylosporangium fulvum TaxID=53359 RepID=A0ABY5VRN9_9ACTN|nr:hypothetical protein [Dactylosporangium fulvum]UWP80437.1 hypothetical protein Dfulv_35490 [Dactylosporangium fulvum]